MRKETRCHHIRYSFRLTARVLLYAPSHRQDSTYHCLWYTSRGALAGTRNSSMGSPHEGSIRRPIAPWANALTTELHLISLKKEGRKEGRREGRKKGRKEGRKEGKSRYLQKNNKALMKLNTERKEICAINRCSTTFQTFTCHKFGNYLEASV